MSDMICINKKLWDQTRELLEERKTTIETFEEIVTEHGETIFSQRNELATQRRTIATLRARLAYKAQGYQEDVCFLGDYLNQYRQIGCEFRKHDLHGLHERRIAAIRNFGALP